MANNNLLQVEEIVSKINAVWDAHTQKVNLSKKALQELRSEYDNLPSKYTENLNKVKSSTDNLAASTRKLTKEVNEEVVQNRILNQQKTIMIKSNTALAGAYAQLSAKAQIASKNLRDYIVAGRQAGQTNKEFETGLKKLQNEFDNYNRKLLQADKAVGAWGRTNQRVIQGATQLMSAFGIATGLYLAVDIARNIFNTARELESLNKALEQVTDTQQNFAEQQSFLKRISEAYGVELTSLTEQFTQFYVSAKDKLSGQQIQDIFESITKAGAKMGLSVESQKRAFLALNQMMSKGTIQAEELRGQLGEALPGAFGIMARAIGVTEKELGNMMKAGDVIASEVLPKFAKELEKTYGIENINRIETMSAGVNRLKNSWTSLVEAMMQNIETNKDSWIGRYFREVIFWADLGMDALKRFLSTRAQLNQQAEAKGVTEGDSLFKSLMGDKQGKEAVLQATKNITQANKELLNVRELLTINGDNDQKQKERLLKAESKWQTVISKSKQLIDDINNAKTTENGTTEKTKEELAKEAKARKELADQLERELKIRHDLEVARAERELKQLNASLEKEELYFNDRLALLDKIAQKETEIAFLKYTEALRLHKDSNDQMEIDAIDFANKIDEINKKRTDNGIKELKRYYDEFESYNNKYEGEGLKLKLFGDDPKADFEKWREGADNAKKSTDELKQATENWVASFRKGFFGDLGFNTLFDLLEGRLEGFGDKWDVTMLGILEVTKETLGFISQLSDRRYQKEYDNLKFQYEIGKKFAIEGSEARAELDRQYEARLKEIRIREFKAKKRLAIVEANINIAQGVIASLAKGGTAGIVMAGIIGALGVVQLATINSQQMPEYWTGTENAKEGLALTQERGREFIFDRSGKLKSTGSDKGATLTKMDGGETVWNAEKTKKALDSMMFNDQLNNILTSNGISSPKIEINNNNANLEAKLDELNNTIKNKPTSIVSIDKNGIKTQMQIGNSLITKANNSVTFTGTGV